MFASLSFPVVPDAIAVILHCGLGNNGKSERLHYIRRMKQRRIE